MIDGPKGLTSRVTALEMQILNGTSLTLATNKRVRPFYKDMFVKL